jgi:membrane-anchored glycerophosphoryl diester phosphodiesterase (GDPDase)
MEEHKQEKNNWIISLRIISLIMIIVVVSIISLVCWIILDKLSPSEEYIDCLNCNPDVLSQFSHPAFFILPILGVLLVLVALIIGIKNVRNNPQ